MPANMEDPNSWRDLDVVISHLAEELLKGRLGILLGAGVSAFYGLPNWKTLVNDLSIEVGLAPLESGDDPLARADRIRSEKFARDARGFCAAVKRALYKDTVVDFEKISESRLLRAIGTVVMASKRGNAANVITLNFDDLLEVYLEYYGFTTKSICNEAHWAPNADVAIYHPHGLLALSVGRAESEDLVLTETDFLKIIDNSFGNAWRPLLFTLLRTHTFIHIGTSGDDIHVKSLLSAASDKHAVTRERIAYGGVFFAKKGSFSDDSVATLKSKRVFVQFVSEWNDLPSILLKLCQVAREKYMETR